MKEQIETTEQKVSYIRGYEILTAYRKEDNEEFIIDNTIDRIEKHTVSDAMSGIGHDIYSGEEIMKESTDVKNDSNGNPIKKEFFYRVDTESSLHESGTDYYGSTIEQVLQSVDDCELLSDFEECYRVVDFTQLNIDTENKIKQVFGGSHKCNAERELYTLKSKIHNQSKTFVLDAWSMFEKIRNFCNEEAGFNGFKFIEKNEGILREWHEVGQMLLAIEYVDVDTDEVLKKELFEGLGYKDEFDYINNRVINNIHQILNYDKIFWRTSIFE